MLKTIKKIIPVVLCISIILSFSGCSSKTEMTEENITKTVETVEASLQEFDIDKLEKYVDSSTLSYILSFAKNQEQFAALGEAIFKNLTMEIENIDLQSNTVTVSVKNKDLSSVATLFASEITQKYSTFQLLQKLSDDLFLDTYLADLTENIGKATMNDSAISIKLSVTQGKKNLMLSFDETAEDAVSGGALTAIKNIIGI